MLYWKRMMARWFAGFVGALSVGSDIAWTLGMDTSSSRRGHALELSMSTLMNSVEQSWTRDTQLGMNVRQEMQEESSTSRV